MYHVEKMTVKIDKTNLCPMILPDEKFIINT